MATRSEVAGSRIFESVFGVKNKFQVGKLNDAAQSIGDGMQPVLFAIPTAARTYTMRAVTAANDGEYHIIVNLSAGANDMTINNSAAAGIGTIAQNEAGLVMVVNGAWRVLLVGTST